jgi:hypothetical protein
MRVANVVCQARLFFVQTLAILGIQLAVMFRIVATLCENGGTPYVAVKSKDTFAPLTIPHLVFEANHMKA